MGNPLFSLDHRRLHELEEKQGLAKLKTKMDNFFLSSGKPEEQMIAQTRSEAGGPTTIWLFRFKDRVRASWILLTKGSLRVTGTKVESKMIPPEQA